MKVKISFRSVKQNKNIIFLINIIVNHYNVPLAISSLKKIITFMLRLAHHKISYKNTHTPSETTSQLKNYIFHIKICCWTPPKKSTLSEFKQQHLNLI